MNDCRKQKHSMAQLSCIPNRVWKSLRWLVRYCSYSTAVPRDSSPRLYKPSHMGFIVGGRGLTPADPWMGDARLPLQSLSAFVREHRLFWPALYVQSGIFFFFFWRELLCPFDVFMEKGKCGCTSLSVCSLFFKAFAAMFTSSAVNGVNKIIS